MHGGPATRRSRTQSPPPPPRPCVLARSDACHLSNERLRRLNLIRGKNVVRHLMEELAATSMAAGAGAAGSGGTRGPQAQQSAPAATPVQRSMSL